MQACEVVLWPATHCRCKLLRGCVHLGEVTERKVHKIMSIFINIGRELNWKAITTISIIIALLFNLFFPCSSIMEHTFLTFAPYTVFFSFLCLFVGDEFIFMKGTLRAGRS